MNQDKASRGRNGGFRNVGKEMNEGFMFGGFGRFVGVAASDWSVV